MSFFGTFKKAAKYGSARTNEAIDNAFDDKLKVEMAVNDQRKNHAAVEAQAAEIIGRHKQLEMDMARKATKVEQLTVQVRQAVTLAEQRQAAGDLDGYNELLQTADQLANDLVVAEEAMESHRGLITQAKVAADQAAAAVAESRTRTQEVIENGRAMVQRLDQLEMQEQTEAARQALEGGMLQPDDGSSFAAIQDKIRHRLATANAEVELAQGGAGAKMAEVRQLSLESAGRSRLDQIRAEMAGSRALPPLEVGAETQAKLDQLKGEPSS